jgi:hypothetical protein
MMLENCHNAPSWWSPQADAATGMKPRVILTTVICFTQVIAADISRLCAAVCDSNMWRSGGDIGNGFGGAHGEAQQWFGKNNLSDAHPWGAAPISRPGCW